MKFVVSAVLLLHVAALGAASPVERVVKLLQDMKQRLETDNSNEQQSYDKYACWCEKTTSRKAASIDSNRVELRSLGQEILTHQSTVAEKTLEVKEALAEIKENEEAQQLATGIRQKENAAYQAETAETKQAIDALGRATIILRDASSGGASLVQHEQKGESESAYSASMQKAQHAFNELSGVLAAAPERLLAKLDRHTDSGSNRLQLLSRFTQSLNSVSKAKYAPQSMTIQGILKDLYDTFAGDLESKDSDEAGRNRNYEDLMATKQQEAVELQDKVEKAEKVKVEAETMLTEALQTYDETEQQLKDEVAFFDVTKTSCTEKSQGWANRKSLREEELAGISEALRILTSDDARDLFGKAIQPGVGFLQVATVNDAALRKPAQRAVKALRQHAVEAHSIRLAAMASKVQLAAVGHFEDVIKSIDTMIGMLQQERTDDLAFRDKCNKELHDIESKMKDLTWKIKVNDAQIAKLTEVIDKMEKEITKTFEDIQVVAQQLVDMNATRIQENGDFQTAKEDDVQAIQLLEEAKDALGAYYANHSINLGPTESGKAALLGLRKDEPEFQRSEDDAPDTEFAHRGKRKNEAKGIVGLLETIIEDLNAEIANSVKAEEAAQLQYEAEKKAAEDLKSTLEEKKVNLESDIALRKSEKTDEEGKKEGNENDHIDQDNAKKGIEPDCVEDHFMDRKAKREAEMEGLRQAKDFLAGYKPQADQGDGSDAPGAALLGESKSPQVAHLRGLAPVGRHVA